MGQLHKNIDFLLVSFPETDIIFGTAFIGKYVENISPSASIITPMNSSPVARENAICRDHVLPIESYNTQGKLDRSAAKQLCVATRKTKLASMSETIVKVNISVVGIQLVNTHEFLLQK